MSEEQPFKSMRITLSDEALSRLEVIKQRGRFRSYSGAIEEIIRAIFNLMPIYGTVAQSIKERKKLPPIVLESIVDQSKAHLDRFVLMET